MKKGFMILAIVMTMFITNNIVKADTFSVPSIYTKSEYISNTNFSKATELLSEYNTNYSKQYPYYILSLSTDWSLFLLQNINQITTTSYSYNYGLDLSNIKLLYYENNEITSTTGNYSLINIDYNNNGITSSSFGLDYYDSNLPSSTFIFNPSEGEFPFNSLNITNFYSDSITIDEGQSFPKLKDLLQYNSWSDYENNHLEGYTEVNLDNYEYVLLSLKDYSQTKAFSTNLQVKGQVGITPIYNYGQTSKDSITGVQVQDRCNVAYESYTSYPLYILKTDLQNNAIYAVKECEQGSSFKFNNEIFDVTYITEENKDNPKVTINGKTYDVIPYDNLPSTATKNEEDNYIPGQSENAIDGTIKNIQQQMSEIWNTFTYFTDFVGQLFSTLPTEIRTMLLSAFVVAIVLGLIKIFIN